MVIQLQQQSDPVFTQLRLHLLSLQIFPESEQESNDLPPGTFLSHLSCWNDSHTWPVKLIGPSPNRSHFRKPFKCQSGMPFSRSQSTFSKPQPHRRHTWKLSPLRRSNALSRDIHALCVQQHRFTKTERTTILKCQAVGLPLKYLPSPTLSILIDKATFDNAACCHRDIWSALFSFFPLFFTWLTAE